MHTNHAHFFCTNAVRDLRKGSFVLRMPCAALILCVCGDAGIVILVVRTAPLMVANPGLSGRRTTTVAEPY